MRQIASGGDVDDDDAGQDQDHGHDERGAMRKIQPIPRAAAECENEAKVRSWQSKGV